jgi:hypothetical protein
MAEKITKSHPIGLEQFWSSWMNNVKIWNLYAENIMFACSLTISTSTWCPNHCIQPGGYMSGELKSENINIERTPLKEAISQPKIHSHPNTYNQLQARY